jgi:hypothetical protein
VTLFLLSYFHFNLGAGVLKRSYGTTFCYKSAAATAAGFGDHTIPFATENA